MCAGPPKNVIICGTKLDLVRKNESLREVQFEEALDLAKRLNCCALIETSSKDDKTMEIVESLNDCFLISAFNCYETSQRRPKAEDQVCNKSIISSTAGPAPTFYNGQAARIGRRTKVQSEAADQYWINDHIGFHDFLQKIQDAVPESEFNGHIPSYQRGRKSPTK